MSELPAEIREYLTQAAMDSLTFITACANNLDGRAEQALISSVTQFIDIMRKELNSRISEDSCVSAVDIVESQLIAFRRCLLDLEGVRERMLQEEKLN